MYHEQRRYAERLSRLLEDMGARPQTDAEEAGVKLETDDWRVSRRSRISNYYPDDRHRFTTDDLIRFSYALRDVKEGIDTILRLFINWRNRNG